LFEKEFNDTTNVLFETSKVFSKDSVDKVKEGTDHDVKTAFNYKEWVSKYDNVLTLTFDFNPIKQYNNLENELAGFFDYYYGFSKTMLMIPNLTAEKTKSEITPSGIMKKIGNEKIVSIKDYLKYVDESYRILSLKNGKPIFVPLSLNFNIDEIKMIANEYIKKERYYIWIDYEGTNSADLTKLGKLRHFLRQFKGSVFNNVIIFSTNIKREIISHKSKIESPSSDVLASIMGANIIGVNREPKRGGSVDEPGEYKPRVLDPSTYYYLTEGFKCLSKNEVDLINNKNYNVSLNARLLANEYANQKNIFLEKNSIREYICNKRMIREFEKGILKSQLFIKEQSEMSDFVPI